MTKKGNLAAALNGFDRNPSSEAKPLNPKTQPEKKDMPASGVMGAKSLLPPSRQGKKALTGYFSPEVIKQLKVLAASEEKTMQALMSEAINELFKKYNRPHIA